ncbi:MAG: sigma-70 family RNA polymerase sigma factor [Actinophytocola sp.]|uniref:RNA polymerase sigma factor n=1 Tax=Actinophytocola sp. TaxID=1872138 RepID=UPI003C786166
MPEDTTDMPSDATLAAAVRGGDPAAFGVLYARHLQAARRFAAALGINGAERDDLIAEGFTRVLRIMRSGRGPDEDFRPYLLTTMRNTVISWRRYDRTVSLFPDVPETRRSTDHDDPMGARVDATMAAEAFAGLPERWRTVLWRTEIEGESPAQIAGTLSMTPNGVAALAYRAREGLRQAYLAQYLPATGTRTCRTIVGQLAGWVRQGGTNLRTRRITDHLAYCVNCRHLEADLQRVNQELPATKPIVPAFLTRPASWSGAVKSVTAAIAAIMATVGTLIAGPAPVTTARTVPQSASPLVTDHHRLTTPGGGPHVITNASHSR